MLSKSNRLSKLQFDEVFKKGRVFHSPIFVMRVFFGSNDYRFSPVIPQKIAKTAAERNSSRRKVYNILRQVMDVKNITENKNKFGWLILIAKKSLKNVDKDEIKKDITDLFVKSGILE